MCYVRPPKNICVSGYMTKKGSVDRFYYTFDFLPLCLNIFLGSPTKIRVVWVTGNTGFLFGLSRNLTIPAPLIFYNKSYSKV